MVNTHRLWHRFFLRAALSFSQIFAWIFVFQYFFAQTESLEAATVSLALTYALTQSITILLSPLSAQGLRHGYKHLMVCAVLALVAAYALFAIAFLGGAFVFAWGVSAFAILMGVYRALYWTPYRIAAGSNPAGTPLWSEYVLALLPLIAGWILDSGAQAPMIVFGLAALLALFSLIPLLSMNDSHEGFAWKYRETFHQIFVHDHRRMTLSAFMHGIEMSLLLIVWPIIVFVILGWSYAVLGAALSVIYVLSLIARAFIRAPMRALSTPTHALLAASAWIMRLSVSGSIGIILIDTYYYSGSNTQSRGMDMLTLEHGADNTTYVDEYTVLKEISMALGRLMMALVVAFLASNISVTYTFAIVFALGALAAVGGIFLAVSRTRI